MGLADWFSTFCGNLQIPDDGTISSRYKAITRRLNTDFLVVYIIHIQTEDTVVFRQPNERCLTSEKSAIAFPIGISARSRDRVAKKPKLTIPPSPRKLIPAMRGLL